MVILNTLASYSDDNDNRILYDGPDVPGARIEFTGSSNTLEVSADARLGKFHVVFDCDNGQLRLGGHKFGNFSGFIRIGEDSLVSIGSNVTTTNNCVISAVEGTSVVIGDDVMLATDNEIRSDDGHAIFDVASEGRVNLSKDIYIGNHVWLAKRAVLLGGASIGDGSVVGFGSLVTGSIPNNSVAAGVPARVIRRNIAWERPHLSRARPFYKPDASTVHKSPYWNKTVDSPSLPQYAVVYGTTEMHVVASFITETEALVWSKRHFKNEETRIVQILKREEAEIHLLKSVND